jgi:hypothetical protein
MLRESRDSAQIEARSRAVALACSVRTSEVTDRGLPPFNTPQTLCENLIASRSDPNIHSLIRKKWQRCAASNREFVRAIKIIQVIHRLPVSPTALSTVSMRSVSSTRTISRRRFDGRLCRRKLKPRRLETVATSTSIRWCCSVGLVPSDDPLLSARPAVFCWL